jgi:hypothetical protein
VQGAQRKYEIEQVRRWSCSVTVFAQSPTSFNFVNGVSDVTVVVIMDFCVGWLCDAYLRADVITEDSHMVGAADWDSHQVTSTRRNACKSSCKVSVIVDFNQNWNVSTHFCRILKYQIHENSFSSYSVVLYADGHACRHGEANRSIFATLVAIAPRNEYKVTF